MGRKIMLRGSEPAANVEAIRPQTGTKKESERQTSSRRIVLIRDGKLVGAAAGR